MTQLPFPSHPSPLPPAPNPQPTIPYDHHRRTSVSSIASSRVSRTPFAHEVPYQASPQLPYPSDLPRYSLVNPAPGYSPALPRDPGHPAYQGDPVSRSPIPPPRRSATLPSTPSPIAQYSHQAASVVGVAAVPAEDPVAAHHRTLVAYYWHYAQQGFSAPLTALFGTDEYGMQERARREAVDWARQCGMAVKEPETQNGGEGGEEAIRARTTSRPLPSAPSPAATVTTNGTPPVPLASRPASIVGIGSGRPLPSAPSVVPHRSISLANPPHPIIPAATPPSRSVSEAQPRTQPFPPSSSASPLPASPFTVETLPSGRKRPLPMPPAVPASPVDTAQIGDQLQSISISAPPPARSPSPKPAPPVDPSIPTFTFGDESTPIVPPPRSPSPHPAPPAVPTFSFNDEPEQTSPSPAVPSFSFSVDEDPSPSPTVASSRRAPPVHPRYDPSHPSHALYHPTSVASPLPQSNSHPTIPTLTEAGTIDCTSCQLPIFGRVLLALSRSWHPGCFVCAEEGCAEKLEVMEFEGTPEDWEDSRGQGQEEDESLIGKAWCMVHFEEVSFFDFTLAQLHLELILSLSLDSVSLCNAITVTRRSLQPTTSQSLTLHSRLSIPHHPPTRATTIPYTSSVPVVATLSSIQSHTKDQEKRSLCHITFGNNILIARSVT